ncbi:MAG TPA: hypothetical protein VKA15_23505 [Isosphaeraceae bacterium]|nr:hypothetical protein [Isosphaeraceae bacterium]
MTQNHGERQRAAWLIVASVLALNPVTATSAAAGDEWRYVLPSPGDPVEHPPLRAIPLSRTRPDDVKEMVRYRGNRQRYAQIRYGSPGSVRVTIVLDESATGEAGLFVDADRNRRIEDQDRVAGEGRTWRLPLPVAVVEGEATTASGTRPASNSSTRRFSHWARPAMRFALTSWARGFGSSRCRGPGRSSWC